MHELAIVNQILDVTLQYAQKNHATSVKKVSLAIGELHDLIPEWVIKYFRYASRSTIAKDAEVDVERMPIICRCDRCSELFVYHLRTPERQDCCPICDHKQFSKLSGSELMIKSIEITKDC